MKNDQLYFAGTEHDSNLVEESLDPGKNDELQELLKEIGGKNDVM